MKIIEEIREHTVTDPISRDAIVREVWDRFPSCNQLLEALGLNSPELARQRWDVACWAKFLEPTTVVRILQAAERLNVSSPSSSVELMSFPELCDHLVERHRVELHDELDQLSDLFAEAEREADAPRGLRRQFTEFRDQLIAHLKVEEEELYPLIRKMGSLQRMQQEDVERLRHWLATMKHEHDEVDEALSEMASLLETREWPQRASEWVGGLREAHTRLEKLLHGQIYEENQVLFRRVEMALKSH